MMMAEEREIEHWHVKKEVTWGHIMTTVGMVVAGMMAFGSIDSRITVVEVTQSLTQAEHQKVTEAQNRRIDESQKALERQIDSLGGDIKDVLHKIDKLIDRELNGNKGR
jgi:cell division protein FtsB